MPLFFFFISSSFLVRGEPALFLDLEPSVGHECLAFPSASFPFLPYRPVTLASFGYFFEDGSPPTRSDFPRPVTISPFFPVCPEHDDVPAIVATPSLN